MANIPNQAIKKLIKRYAKVNITEDGAEALGRILEKKAMNISRFAVKNAKKQGRSKITKEDVLRSTVDSE
ncbi:MAG: NFYB/HAP3 family transcription factor subunit [Candidatus Micrarchaeota archaeon]|nr:NFYB/HAP3 family transcription factor subunit [Candidatus Micrarchaeota archaeon]MDE1847443.1 NFYB/HAP3 family transcription factor subunit [Candidatus Micrarchaeota archaeon]MDE1864062.1 NFYB/HAP3 family transcription factor subunit [Candidatus Micrarchaeota archaeon]